MSDKGRGHLSYFGSRIGKSWEDVEIINLHGTRQNLWPAVWMHERLFAVTGGKVEEHLGQLCPKTVCWERRSLYADALCGISSSVFLWES